MNSIKPLPFEFDCNSTPFEIIEGQPLQRYLDEIEIADDAMAADVVDENIDA